MKDDIHDIGDLFKAELEDATMEPKSTGWTDLQPGLDKNAFMRFAIYRFNVYYMSLIVLAFLFASYAFFHSIFYNRTTMVIQADEKPESASHIQTGRVSSERTEVDPGKRSTVKQSAPSFMHKNTGEAQQLNMPADSLPSQSATTTTNAHTPKQTEELVAPKKIPEQHKVLYITKQDTVVIIDSIDAATARKRMKRNK